MDGGTGVMGEGVMVGAAGWEGCDRNSFITFPLVIKTLYPPLDGDPVCTHVDDGHSLVRTDHSVRYSTSIYTWWRRCTVCWALGGAIIPSPKGAIGVSSKGSGAFAPLPYYCLPPFPPPPSPSPSLAI